jgi:hypothetical protein
MIQRDFFRPERPPLRPETRALLARYGSRPAEPLMRVEPPMPPELAAWLESRPHTYYCRCRSCTLSRTFSALFGVYRP